MRAIRPNRTLPRSTDLLPSRDAARRARAIAPAAEPAARALALAEMRAAVAAAANESGTAAGALRAALREVCTRLGFPAGRAIVLDTAGRAREVLWHGSPRRFGAFRDASAAVAPADTRGVAGRALAAAEPVWIADADEDATLAVWAEARRAGLRSALAFPVTATGGAVAVVEAWSPRPAAERAVLDACAFAARQLGAAFEREAERAALRAEAGHLRAVVAAAPAGAVAFGADGQPALWTSTTEALLGGAPSDVAAGWRGARAAAGAAIGGGHPATRMLRTGDGRALKLRITPGFVADGGQGAAGWVWKPRTPAPAAVTATAQDRWPEQALATVVHDLRSPLSGITLAAESLLRVVPADDEREPERRLLGAVTSAAERMRHLLNDLLDTARMDGGALPIAPRPVAVGAMLDDAAEAQRLQAEARGITLSVSRSAACEVMADERRVAQVLQNLVGNALAYTPAGGEVTLSAEVRGDEARVSVSDTGRGIAAADLPRVFDRFWRAAGARGKGAGLGLAIARGIVEAHGGTIHAESTVGRGTTMVFTLPLAAELALAA